MANTDDLRAISTSILTKRSTPAQTAAESLTRAAGGADAEAAAPSETRVFTSFIPAHQWQGVMLADRLMSTARSIGGDEGLEAALREAEQASETENLDLVKYALMVFITHFPEASKLRIPSLLEREPHKLASSMPDSTDEAGIAVRTAPQAAAIPETALNWFREDPLANEHHERWHVVYPFVGVPDGTGGATQLRPRQGELFVYMHEQMLARYDTERLAAGMDLVVPFEDYTQTITEGYDPGPLLSQYYTPRPDDQTWHDMKRFNDGSYVGGVYHVSDHESHRDLIMTAMQTGSFAGGGGAVDPSNIGSVLESSIGSPSAVTTPPPPAPPQVMSQYGQLHNWGHLFFSVVTDPNGTTNPGVMGDTATAIRDYVFFRWHRHIDNFSFTWQETQPANNFSDAPNVVIRKGLDGKDPQNQSPDIILCFASQIPGFFNPDGSINEGAVTAFGEQQFGGNNWDSDFSSTPPATDELLTYMYTRQYEYRDEQGPTGTPIISQETVKYLDQEEYAYFLRVENLDNVEKKVTARVFLAAEEVADNRRLWIEMDKFAYTLEAGQRAVIARPAAFSSVIRKPASKPPQFIPIRRATEDPDSPIDYCDCGWPYNVLLPKGTSEGMGFRFLVMFTDWNLDHVPQDTTCGSMSYCGSKSDYPDQRVMGYPFDRPFTNSSIAEMVASLQNVATRDITIRFGGTAPSEGTPQG